MRVRDDRRESTANRGRLPSALWGAGGVGLLGFSLIGAFILHIAHQDPPTDNTPLEEYGPFAVFLTLGAIVIALLVRAFRSRRAGGPRLRHVAPLLSALAYAGLVVYFLLASLVALLS
jgi:hypothetical protein